MAHPSTEDTSAASINSHDWTAQRLVAGILEDQARAVAAVQSAATQLAHSVDEAVPRLEAGGRLIFCGAGTSGRIAVQDATELFPTYHWPVERALVLMAGGTKAIYSAVERAEDKIDAAAHDINALSPDFNDVVVGVAASGNTPYTVEVLTRAKAAGSLTIAFYNNRVCKMADLAACPVLLETGAEFVTGSTRMKAGTAQKAALNILTTSVMIRLGRVYRGQMVDMPATNDKLTERCVRIVARVTEADQDVARRALSQTNWEIKPAIVMIEKRVTAQEAHNLLAQAGGHLRAALD